MPLQNRITPFGEIVRSPERGLFMGNRGGRIHDPETKTLKNRRWASKQWICCRLRFKDRHRAVMGPGYTELFFLDEVIAVSAGHRPCFECRRADARAFAAAWARAGGLEFPPKAGEMDRVLHRERQVSGWRPDDPVAVDDLPDGAMIALDGKAFAIRDNTLLCWSHGGYTKWISRKDGQTARLLTPPAIVDTLRQGYEPQWHETARRPVSES